MDYSKSKNNGCFSLAWAYMPLSEEEMSKIDFRHHMRPYLLCMEKDDYFYAFPCTSQVEKNKSRYQNGKVILSTDIDYKKSLVDLSKIYKLPKDNIRSEEYRVFDYQENEIIKKMQANFEYCDYPDEVKDYIGNKETFISVNDLIESNGQLFVVVGINGKNTLYVLPVFRYPVNNTIEAETDGLKYYVKADEILEITRSEVDKYCTQLFGFSYGSNKKNKSDLRKLLKLYRGMSTITCSRDFTKFCNLEPGMIISYKVNGVVNKMIILGNYESDLEVIAGLEDELYCDFKPMNLPSDVDFEYEIVNCLNDERLTSLQSKSIEDVDYKTYIKK